MSSTIGFIGAQEPDTEKLPLYFEQRGFGVRRWADLVGAPQLDTVKDAIVLFADGFDAAAIVSWVKLALAAAPTRLVVVLTATRGQFDGPTALRGENVLHLVRPVMAWQLVDVIRNHVGGAA